MKYSYTMSKIEEVVRTRFCLTHHEMIMPKTAERRYSRPRQIAMLLMREYTGASLPDIGQHFCRSHATVYRGILNIQAVIDHDPKVAADVEACRTLVKRALPWLEIKLAKGEDASLCSSCL